MTVRWEDESKTLQAAVHFKAEMFTRFVLPPGPGPMLGVQLSLLLDTLAMFASAPTHAPLQMLYPGPQGEVVFELQDNVEGKVVVSFARLGTVELPSSRDLSDYWEGQGSYFLAQGVLLKEVVEDLEWPAGDVEIAMWAPPHARLAMSAAGVAGDLEVDLPLSELSGFHVTPPPPTYLAVPGAVPGADVRWRYRYKSMRAAFCSLSPAKEPGSCSTKVSIDANGLLKVTHMVSMQGASAQGGGPGTATGLAHSFAHSLGFAPGQAGRVAAGTGQHAEGQVGAYLDSQRGLEDGGTAVVTFVMVPLVEGVD